MVRRAGFLCVICDLSTFFSEEVMAEPELSWAKTPVMSPPFEVEGADGVPFMKSGGGRGGGGGASPDGGCAEALGVAVPDWTLERASRQSMPSFWFQERPVG